MLKKTADSKSEIIQTLADDACNIKSPFSKKFGMIARIYDFKQEHFTRPRIHKADPTRHREILASLIAPLEKSRVLDVACGTGNAIAHFHESNEYTGLDLSYDMLKQAVKKAKKKLFSSCQFIQGNAQRMIFEDASFDCVLMDTALHMIPNYQAAIMEISRVLVDDGIFICSTPTVGINREFDLTWEKMTADHPLHSLTVSDLEKACSQAGLGFCQRDTNGGMLYFQADKS